MHQRRRHPELGFTLIEVILVMVIISIAAAVIVPSLARFSRGRQSADALEQMRTVLQYAQDQSISKGTPIRFHLKSSGQSYWLTSRQEGTFTRPGSDFGRTFTVPPEFTVTWDGSPEIASRGYIEFEPDGAHDVAVIKLTDQQGNVTLIGSASPSEPYRLAQSEAQEIQ